MRDEDIERRNCNKKLIEMFQRAFLTFINYSLEGKSQGNSVFSKVVNFGENWIKLEQRRRRLATGFLRKSYWRKFTRKFTRKLLNVV